MVANAPRWYEMHQNMGLESNGLDRECSLRKIPPRLRGTNFCTSSAHFPPSFLRQPNGPECTQMVRNTPKRQLRVKWSGSGAFVAKIPKQLHGTNFCINYTCSTRLHRVSCSNETLPNAPKYYEMHQNMSLGSNGVGRVHSLRKIPKRLHETNLCINCPSSTHFATSFV